MKLPSLFIPHGGGPCFFMNPGARPDPMWRPMESYLEALIADLPERPKAILLVSGHWEEAQFTVHMGNRPDLLFDYHNFPPHTYQLRWDAPGAPALAHRAATLLSAAGFPTGAELARGWDHGVFIPMMVSVPDADIPLAQLSMRADLDPTAHIAAGRALAPLRDEGVLIVGSGMSFHNLRERGAHVTARADAWDDALTAAVTDPDPAARADRVARWSEMPFARFAHPREEHLIPLMVALGAGGDDPASCDFTAHVMGWTVSGYRFG
ncbi:DODA-type extradiol aromatic ring-opening family dioxygenase [Sphingobium boeckii]|uniref:Aromatic ring-opening dioxygenase catalytic subunit (LigB family) n=1 Tax=Sphingobium boeckii TaxID=1082345 RepID=A0A7W9AEI9_9SPHN|nr:class III extradiol ring-cleavage dioxygenase [Sphingobium boeckii]MBB5684203.1 aromatic ring-opening dioxygenase catalytic subunit (LigB family) [Sphingobium boeckii]